MARRFRGTHAHAGIGSVLVTGLQPAEEAAPARKGAGERARRASPGVKRCDEAANVLGGEARERSSAGECRELGAVTRIGAQRVGGEPSPGAKMAEIALEGARRRAHEAASRSATARGS